MAKGHIVAWSCYATGNVMGRANANPILSTSRYQVEIAGSKDTELIINFVATSI